jgi:hypothetical protein
MDTGLLFNSLMLAMNGGAVLFSSRISNQVIQNLDNIDILTQQMSTANRVIRDTLFQSIQDNAGNYTEVLRLGNDLVIPDDLNMRRVDQMRKIEEKINETQRAIEEIKTQQKENNRLIKLTLLTPVAGLLGYAL